MGYAEDVARLADAAPWDDWTFPATGINLPGAASDPDRDTSTALLLFGKSATQTIAEAAQMPHRWKAGTGIRPHLHYKTVSDPAGVGGHVWTLEYKWYNAANDTVPADYTTLTAVGTAPDHVGGLVVPGILEFGAIDGTGKRESSFFEFRLSRTGGDERDTYDDDIALLAFDIHIRVGKHGTLSEYPDV